jgi:hypothetical protein
MSNHILVNKDLKEEKEIVRKYYLYLVDIDIDQSIFRKKGKSSFLEEILKKGKAFILNSIQTPLRMKANLL